MCQFWEELKEEGRAEERALMNEERALMNKELSKAKAQVEKAEAKAKQTEAEAKAKQAEAKAKQAEAEAKNLAIKNAFKMLLGGKLSVEEIAEYTNLPIDEVREFAAITAAR